MGNQSWIWPAAQSRPRFCARFRAAVVGGGLWWTELGESTGTFTRDATQEATRDGVVPIELIDGERLCDLLADQARVLR
jgi:hypothetical protein